MNKSNIKENVKEGLAKIPLQCCERLKRHTENEDFKLLLLKLLNHTVYLIFPEQQKCIFHRMLDLWSVAFLTCSYYIFSS